MVVLVLLGVGIAIGLMAGLVITTLLALGVISLSVLIGLRSSRFQSGLKAFFIQCGVLGGLPAGVGCAWLYLFFWTGGNLDWRILTAGALGGVVAGLIMAMLLDSTIRRILSWISSRRVTIGT